MASHHVPELLSVAFLKSLMGTSRYLLTKEEYTMPSRTVPHEEGQEFRQRVGYAKLARDGGCIPVLTSAIDLAVLEMAHKAHLKLKGRLGGPGGCARLSTRG